MPVISVPIRLPATRLPVVPVSEMNTPDRIVARDDVAGARGRAADRVVRGTIEDVDAVGSVAQRDRAGRIRADQVARHDVAFWCRCRRWQMPIASLPETTLPWPAAAPPIVLSVAVTMTMPEPPLAMIAYPGLVQSYIIALDRITRRTALDVDAVVRRCPRSRWRPRRSADRVARCIGDDDAAASVGQRDGPGHVGADLVAGNQIAGVEVDFDPVTEVARDDIAAERVAMPILEGDAQLRVWDRRGAGRVRADQVSRHEVERTLRT